MRRLKRMIEWSSLALALAFGAFILSPVGCVSREKAAEAAGAGAQAAGDALASGSGWVGALIAGAVAAGGALLGVKMASGRSTKKPPTPPEAP